jgi:hypothetical protein
VRSQQQERRRVGRALLVLLVTVGFVVAVSACDGSGDGSGQRSSSGPTTSTTGGPASVGQDGTTSIRSGELQSLLAAIPKQQLSATDEAGLVYMREEEKLARDVYTALGAKWGVGIFSNIAKAEQTHTDAVKALLDRYGINDPTTGKAAGEFTDPRIQALYNDLVKQGDKSLVDALTVGAAIEDLDIADLQERASSARDIQLVYDNLEKGSRNHLRAFVKQLERNGASYTPTHISQAEYEKIIDSSVERGNAG